MEGMCMYVCMYVLLFTPTVLGVSTADKHDGQVVVSSVHSPLRGPNRTAGEGAAVQGRLRRLPVSECV